jgi:hypothetical protein
MSNPMYENETAGSIRQSLQSSDNIRKSAACSAVQPNQVDVNKWNNHTQHLKESSLVRIEEEETENESPRDTIQSGQIDINVATAVIKENVQSNSTTTDLSERGS